MRASSGWPAFAAGSATRGEQACSTSPAAAPGRRSNTNYLLSTDTAIPILSASSAASFSNTRSGWVVGAGYEYMINPNWIVRGEYLHYGFNNGSNVNPIFASCFGFAAASTCGSNVTRSNDSIDVVRLGLSYKFGGYAAAPVAYK
jgi:opacity protein-like surface antigen